MYLLFVRPALSGGSPVDGMCSTTEYGAMPGWDVSNVTDMRRAFYYRRTFNGMGTHFGHFTHLAGWQRVHIDRNFRHFFEYSRES